TSDVEENLLNKQEQGDDAKLANLVMQEKVELSTITLQIYQRETVKRELIAGNRSIDAYRPPFGNRMVEALNYGWQVMQSILVFLAQIWWLILFVILSYFV